MKYVVVLCDGMSDLPCPELDGGTPMERAVKPNMDALASRAEVGLVKTVAPGMKPGSDVANLSVLGYDPAAYYSGRSPLEAVSMGVSMAGDDLAVRCNLVTLSGEEDYAEKRMVDYCGGDISTGEAAELIAAVQAGLGSPEFDVHPGIAYRHCLIWHHHADDLGFLTPPHDITGKVIGEYLSADPAAAPLIDMMKKSYEILMHHPVNIKRIAEGKAPANSIWLWGQGVRPGLDSFEEKFGKKGAMISAVDLLRGIGKCAGMRVYEIEGATGYIDTCFDKKTATALGALDSGCDFAYIHIEAPDECGHRGEAGNKVKAIELIDSEVLPPLLEGLKKLGRHRIMVLPDHPTPLTLRTHTSDPVPFLIYDSQVEHSGVDTFTEQTAAATGLLIEPGHSLMERFLKS